MSNLTALRATSLPVINSIEKSLDAPVHSQTLTKTIEPGVDNDTEDVEARRAANEFEALLIHNMLKSMRKTTMSENSSNEKALYDDMLDEKLADTMIKAGGLGVADQIYAQITKNHGNQSPSVSDTNTARLRSLVHTAENTKQLHTTAALQSDFHSTSQMTDISRLRMATNLWSNGNNRDNNTKAQNFIQPLLPHAQESARRIGTSAQAVLAVAALETGWGQHLINDDKGVPSNNLFGIKATRSDTNFTTTTTTEYIDGETHKLQAKFKKYDSVADSVKGFADFILQNPRYASALKHAGDPEQFLRELQDAGYATDPHYADKAISIMRQIPRNISPL